MWDRLNEELQARGFAQTPVLLNARDCQELRDLYQEDRLYRSTIDMKRYHFGSGSYRYFRYPLPPRIQDLRCSFYESLQGSANLWAERLNQDFRYPQDFADFAAIMQARGQTRSTPLILRYGTGDYNCLHQDIANDLIFPYQVVFGLSDPGQDYTGGQLILTQQRPRMQTIPHILTIPQGAAVIFASNLHPVLGTRGYYRTVFRHGVGKIDSGDRFTLGLVFHDYRDTIAATS